MLGASAENLKLAYSGGVPFKVAQFDRVRLDFFTERYGHPQRLLFARRERVLVSVGHEERGAVLHGLVVVHYYSSSVQRRVVEAFLLRLFFFVDESAVVVGEGLLEGLVHLAVLDLLVAQLAEVGALLSVLLGELFGRERILLCPSFKASLVVRCAWRSLRKLLALATKFSFPSHSSVVKVGVCQNLASNLVLVPVAMRGRTLFALRTHTSGVARDG
mmetsp:Transcript_5461/g.17509  ORF Transcript_5461/g.17509 Transcript_5461/m.17509 type:complete len:217 (+) Transcript_5461:2351-3001(+)